MAYEILIADDILINRRVIKTALKDIGDVIFHEAEDGNAAMRYVLEKDINLIILDLMMPEKNGFEVLHELKYTEKYRLVPVIIYSVLDDIDNIHRALEMGAYDYFTKPLTVEQVKTVLPFKVKNAIESYEQKKLLLEVNKQLEEEIRIVKHISFHDEMTGLYNRRFFEEEMKRLDTEKQLPITLIIGDINGLKFTNDVFGHQEGDRLLKKIAQILKSSCRSEDIIARWGGDEFAIILPGISGLTADGICERIRDGCSMAAKDPIQPSIALGYATKENLCEEMQYVLKEAEDRMYRHKLLENRSTRSSIISSLEKTLYERSFETEEHAKRLAELSRKIGQEIGLSGNELDELSVFAILHDIGKIAIPDSILMKQGKLSGDEWDKMKKHSEIGCRIAQSSQELAHISEYILSHHERWDGTGYPQGLSNTEIPKLSRILAVVDAYDVMTHARPYKKAISSREALEEIEKCAGTQFDPEIAKIFAKEMAV